MPAVSQSFDVRPLTPVIGAEISGIDLRQPLSKDTVAALEQAIHRWRVLFFRDQNITEIPPYGGDTLFSNLALAHAGLSPKIQTLIDDLKAVHRTSGYEREAPPRRDGKKPGPFVSLHPLVRIHPGTGEKILFVNPGVTSHIVGLRERESQALLDLLFDEVTRPEYQVRFHWSPHSIVLWDNQAVAHAGPIDYKHFDMPRVVRRITVAGDLPQGPDGFRSRPLEGELFSVLG